jgi:hypothetical protein
MYQGKDAYKKTEREMIAGNKKISVKEHKFTLSSTRGLAA